MHEQKLVSTNIEEFQRFSLNSFCFKVLNDSLPFKPLQNNISSCKSKESSDGIRHHGTIPEEQSQRSEKHFIPGDAPRVT